MPTIFSSGGALIGLLLLLCISIWLTVRTIRKAPKPIIEPVQLPLIDQVLATPLIFSGRFTESVNLFITEPWLCLECNQLHSHYRVVQDRQEEKDYVRCPECLALIEISRILG